jgi:hypothetical protein
MITVFTIEILLFYFNWSDIQFCICFIQDEAGCSKSEETPIIEATQACDETTQVRSPSCQVSTPKCAKPEAASTSGQVLVKYSPVRSQVSANASPVRSQVSSNASPVRSPVPISPRRALLMEAAGISGLQVSSPVRKIGTPRALNFSASPSKKLVSERKVSC